MSLGEPEDTADEMVRKIRALQETGQQEIAQMEEDVYKRQGNRSRTSGTYWNFYSKCDGTGTKCR